MKTNFLKKTVSRWALFISVGISSFIGYSQNANVQVIHNASDAPNVDVWINGSKALANVAYRTASGFVSLPIIPSPTTVQIATVAPGTTVGTIVLTRTFELTDGAKLLYRKPAYLICTDNELAIEKLLQAYLWR